MQTTRSPRQGVVEATEDDVYYAYRLLLGREPDAEGWQHHCRALAEQRPTVYELMQYFMASNEFASRNARSAITSALVEIPLEGFSLFVRSEDRDIGKDIQATHEYEPHVAAAMRELLHRGDVFVDIGANIGFFTNLAASLVGATGFVVAIEPMDKNVQLIYRSLEKNQFGNVRVHACAASNAMSLVPVTTDSGTSNGQLLVSSAIGARHLLAQTQLMDDLTADLKRLDLVKLDIEGYELLAWRGFRRGLERHRPVVLTEFHPYCMRTFVGVDPTEYLVELFAYASTVHVLARQGRRVKCKNSDDVTQQWEIADRAARADGTSHLDLLIEPRH